MNTTLDSGCKHLGLAEPTCDPWPILARFPNPVFHVDGQTYTLSIARTRADRAEAYGLVFNVYQSSGFTEPGALPLWYSLHNALPETVTFVVKDEDGVPLASASHPQERRQTGTWSNLETASALSHATFSTARTNLRKRTDEFGNRMMLRAKKLVVPADLEEAANIIISSELKSGSSLNDKNYFKDEVEVIVWDYLTDTNAWFLMSDIKEDNRGLVFGNEVPASIAPMTGADTSTDVKWAERVRMRFITGLMVCKEIQYNEGA